MLSFSFCKDMLWRNCIDIFSHAYQFMYNNLTEILFPSDDFSSGDFFNMWKHYLQLKSVNCDNI